MQEYIRHALEFVNKYPDEKMTFEISEQFAADLKTVIDEYAALSENQRPL